MKHLLPLLLLLAACGSTTRTYYHESHNKVFVHDEPRVDTSVVVKEDPPVEEEEVKPPSPSPDHIWVAGYWLWDGRYVWVAGEWMVPPHHLAYWTSGRWRRHRGGWVRVPGYWKR